MKKVLLVLTIISIYFATLLYLPPLSSAAACPKSMTDSQCLQYLQEQAEKLAKEKNKLIGKISSENYNQLTLLQKINYLDSQIASSENQIKQLELQIETKNVEIRILGGDIFELQNVIDTASQEVTRLNNAIEKRMSLSYKYTYITPLEIFLESKNFDTLLRRFKYLAASREKNKELLADLEVKKALLIEEEKTLLAKKADIEKKRSEIEKNKSELFKEKESLSSQRGEKSNLLSISKRNEAEYQASLSNVKKQQDSITKQITSLIMSLYNSGQIPVNTPVKKGQVIGFQGHTGFSYGSHLHFELNRNPFSAGYFTGGSLYGTVGPSKAHEPLMGGILTQTNHYNSLGYAIDLQSRTYNQTDDKYFTKKNQICCYGMCVQSGWYSLRGEGAPVYAIMDGKVSSVRVDNCGGKYTIVKYNNGDVSLHLHLR